MILVHRNAKELCPEERLYFIIPNYLYSVSFELWSGCNILLVSSFTNKVSIALNTCLFYIYIRIMTVLKLCFNKSKE
jgi:hypothetical protein